MNPLPALAIATLLAACSQTPGTSPAPPQPPRSSAAINAQQAEATVAGIHLGATLIPVDTLPDNAIQTYGIERREHAQLLLVSARDGNGDAIAVDGLQLRALAGSLQEAPAEVPLRAIDTNGMTDFIGVVPVSPPTTLRVQVQAGKGAARAEMTFSRDFYPGR